MDRLCVLGILFIVLVTTYNNAHGESKYSWMKYDRFDEIDALYQSVNADNCRSKNKDQMMMRADVVSQLPVYNQLLSRIWYRNRTSLIHIHNMALNRAFFYSYVLQKMNNSETFTKQPNWMYFYMSAAADVNANPYMFNGSAFYFDSHCHYPNWYTTIPFNKTLPLFAPKAFRWDDFRDQDNYLREPTRKVVQVTDAGAGHNMNYTHAYFKMNPWYNTWLPDTKGDKDSVTKFGYYIGIKASNVTGEFLTDIYEGYAFFGPNSPGAQEKDPDKLPVQFTAPYFDCGGSNKWVVSAVAPVVDYMPRYSNFTHMRRPRIVGVTVMDIDFKQIDFNACGVSPGNPGPSYLSGISRCRPKTGCKHKIGYGFKRGGYICHCKPGGAYPVYEPQPFQGEDVEQATIDEYLSGFKCGAVNYRLVLPVIDSLSGVTIEGGGVVVNSAGIELEPGSQRKRRFASVYNASEETIDANEGLNSTSAVHYASSNLTQPKTEPTEDDDPNFTKPVIEKIDGHTIHEIMALAEKLRVLRGNNQFEKTMQLQGTNVVLDFKNQVEEEDSPSWTNVGYEVERMYEKDMADHREYKRKLKEDKKHYNYTLVSQKLRDNIKRIRDRHIERFHADRKIHPNKRRKRALVFDDKSFDRMMQILRKKAGVTADNCDKLPNHQLYLPGDVTYGVKKQFEPEGRTGLRFSQFLSMYLQNVQPDENYGNLRGGGRLHVDHMYGEVLANVMGNYKIYAAGVFFDRYMFENQDGSAREFFGPWAFQKRGSYYAMDRAGLPYHYVNEDWFMKAKSRYATNFSGVKLYKIRAYHRSDPNGTSTVRHEFFPMTYRAAPYELGYWTRPHFRCDGNVDAWVVTYVSPFFGLDTLRTRLEFRGVTTVDVPIHLLEINQCAKPFTVANAFKNTARCDYFSTRCVPQAGFPFLRGSYRCLCKTGFEYWHNDGKFWIEGSLMELEYEKKKLGMFSRFDNLKCRASLAVEVRASLSTVIVLSFVSLLLKCRL